MDSVAHLVVLVTASSETEAQRISRALLDERRAACVNIVPRIESAYWWQGKIESAAEILLIVKTTAAQLDATIRLVKGLHSYQVPEIIALPVIGGNPEYLAWIDRETGRNGA